MSNTILIKEVNNNPVLFNVDNAVDGARLEALQAVKMAEEMAASVFGENAMYADNTTCIITDNPDNPAFPWDVAFDAAKIPEKPKRDTGTLVGLAMPDYESEIIVTLSKTGDIFTAPANGFFIAENHALGEGTIAVKVLDKNDNQKAFISNRYIFSNSGGAGFASIVVPLPKGFKISLYQRNVESTMKFFPCIGEIL